MHPIDLITLGKRFRDEVTSPTLLFEEGGHRIFWLGVPEHTAFRCNTYLIVDNEEGVIIDPGGAIHFSTIRSRISQIIPPERVMALVISDSDPDVIASFALWTEYHPQIRVITSSGTSSLLHRNVDVSFHVACVHEFTEYHFNSGNVLRFIPAPFLHSPGAFVTYDLLSSWLFSGDIWAAVDMDWKLVVEDFTRHLMKLNLFHLDQMASGIAVRGFLRRIHHLPIGAILPHHGSIIPGPSVSAALDYLKNLKCGTDIYYPDIK